MRYRPVTIALILAVAAGAKPHAGKGRGHAERLAPPAAVHFNAQSISSSEQPTLQPGDRGSGVVRAQILLARAHFSCGEIDGNFGSNLQRAVAAYQRDRGLPVTGVVDGPTWSGLNADQAPMLMAYTISPEDEKGPFVPVPTDLLQQAELPALGFSSPMEEIAERFHVSPAVLQALNPGADFSRAGQPLTVPNVLTLPPGEAARVLVTKSESSVRAYDASGKLLAFYSATMGSEHDPLPIGDWKIRGVSRNPAFHYNAKLFWDADDKNAKATIRPGPNNPVGLVWIDLTKEHYGIHGTPEPSRIGHTMSHGCIRLTNWDALELASMVKPGVPAILQE
ncbi:MAG: murein L,D-transpeptidase [Terriglobia bacterium]|nr:MAG: murein L,D-transpeptidase [Terriglobia bacterium]